MSLTAYLVRTGNPAGRLNPGILFYPKSLDGVTYYFIDNQEYFNCAVPYGDIRYDIDWNFRLWIVIIDFMPQ